MNLMLQKFLVSKLVTYVLWYPFIKEGHHVEECAEYHDGGGFFYRAVVCTMLQ
jgi:hypothetical protein